MSRYQHGDYRPKANVGDRVRVKFPGRVFYGTVTQFDPKYHEGNHLRPYLVEIYKTEDGLSLDHWCSPEEIKKISRSR